MAKKILTQATYADDNVQQLPVQVKGQASLVQQTFDKASLDQKTYNNTTLLSELQSETLNDSGAHAIGLKTPNTIAGNVADELDLIRQAGSGSIPPDNSITRPKLASDVRSLMSNQDKAIATNSAAIDELFVSEGISNKIAPTSGKFYDYVGASGVLSQGSIDFGKVFASSVTQGANTLVATNLQVAKDQTVPTNLSDSFKVGDKVTLADDASKEALIVSNVDDGTKTLTFTTNIANAYPSGANVYRSNIKTVGEFYEFAGVGIGAIGYNIENASYDSKSLSTSLNGTNLGGLALSNDGTKAFAVDYTSDLVAEYSLSTPYDISTGSAVDTFSVASETALPIGMVFNDDGSKVYIGDVTSNRILQYSVGTPFDISTMSYDSVSFNTAGQVSQIQGLVFNNDGSKMYVSDNLNDAIYQYSLSTPYDLTTMSYDSKSLSVLAQDGECKGIAFNSDGTNLFVCGVTNDSVFQYSLSVAYDISTATYDTISFSVATEDTSPVDIVFGNTGLKMYILGSGTDAIYQYTSSEDNDNDVLDIDIRMNIQPLESVIDIGAYMDVTNNVLAVDGQVSIVGELDNESYTDLVDTRRAINATNDEIASLLNSTLTANDKVTLEYNLTRSLATDVVKITSILGGVS